MLTQLQTDIIDVAASGFGDVWADQLLMEGEFSERIGAEYLASVSIARKLAAKFPERVRVEVPFGRRLQSVPIARNGAFPFPKEHADGRVDVVLFSDQSRIIPEALVELKRAWAKQPITDDARRIADYLRSKDPVKNASLFGFCLFPIVGRHSVQTLSAEDALLARARTVDRCLLELRSSYPELHFEAHRSRHGTAAKLSWEEREVDEDLVEVIWDSNGFEARIIAIAVTYR
jgi:hypothetical protein